MRGICQKNESHVSNLSRPKTIWRAGDVLTTVSTTRALSDFDRLSHMNAYNDIGGVCLSASGLLVENCMAR